MGADARMVLSVAPSLLCQVHQPLVHSLVPMPPGRALGAIAAAVSPWDVPDCLGALAVNL